MSSTEFDVMQRAEEIRTQRLDALGLTEQYNLWRESLPNTRDISNAEAYSLFLEAQNLESAAIDGRVSVSTGGTDEGPATPTPVPGPDAEETGTDAAGDVSKGPVDGTPIPETDVDKTGKVITRDTELKVVEGMWTPPEEAEALNYDPPSTKEMVDSDEWLEEAKRFYEFMGSPDLRMGLSKEAGAVVREQLEELPRTSDRDIAQWARRQMSSFNWNVAVTLGYAHKIMTSEDPKAALTFLNLINMYEHSSGGAADFGMALVNLASDPTSYTGLGVGQVAARGAAKALAKKELKKAIELSIVGGVGGMIEGATLAGGFNLTVQNIEQEAGARKDIDYGQAGGATALGAGAGIVLGGGGGRLIGRQADKIAAANEKKLADLFGGRLVAEERAVEDIPLDQIEDFLQKEITKDAEQGRKSDTAEMLLRYIQEEREVPRLADGSIDQPRLAEEIKKYHDRTVPRKEGALAKISDNDPTDGEITIDYDVLADDDTTGRIYEFFDAMDELFGEDVNLTLKFEEGKATIRARTNEGFKVEYGEDVSIAEMIHEEWELREKFGPEGPGVKVVERPGEGLEAFDNDNWNIDEATEDLTYNNPEQDYSPLEEAADAAGVEWSIVDGKFFVKGDQDTIAFLNNIIEGTGGEFTTPRLVAKWNRRIDDFFGEPSPEGNGITEVDGGVDILTENYDDTTGPEFLVVLEEIARYAKISHAVTEETIRVRGEPREIQRFLEIESKLRETADALGPAFTKMEGDTGISWIPDPAGGTRTIQQDQIKISEIIREIADENNIEVKISGTDITTGDGTPAKRVDAVFENEVDRKRFQKLWETRFRAVESLEERIRQVAAALPHPAAIAARGEGKLPARGEEKIIEGRRGGKPLSPKEGKARGLAQKDIAELEINPVNVLDRLERAGFKVTLGKEGDIVFDATGMSPATTERISRVAAQTGVKSTPVGALTPPEPLRADQLIAVEAPAPTDPVDRALYDAYRVLEKGGTDADMNKAMQKWLNMEHERSGGELVVETRDAAENVTEVYRGTDLQAADKAWRVADAEGTPVNTSHTTERGDFDPKGAFDPQETGTIEISGDPVDIARFGAKMAGEVQPARLPMAESKELARRIAEIEATAKREVVGKSASLPGSFVRDTTGAEYEVMGRTKNGWYHLRNKLTGEEVNRRRNEFEVTESHPKPERAGPMEMAPFTANAAKIIAMNEDVVSGKLEKVQISIPEQKSIVKALREMGIKIDQKKLATFWTPAELLYLRDTYNAMANGMLELGRALKQDLKNSGRLTDEQMAMFNEAHTTFVATRDLFFGVSGNAARSLHVLRTKPTDEVYEFSQALLDSISISGGRTNTERAISMFAKLAEREDIPTGKTKVGMATDLSDSIWGNKVAAGFLIVRYNQMLSSWRTHFFNFMGNSGSGVYQHLMVNPVKMGINNAIYASNLARAVLDPKYTPDPADRLRWHSYWAGLRSHFASARDSMALAKEIALGHDIGEGKVWNELGLRYNVINVPESMFAKLGTTPVRMLEAGDAFFKNQYYMSKIHELASIKAKVDEVHKGLNFEVQYKKYVNSPEAPMIRQAKEYAAIQTYTNDPSVYGGVLAALARGAAAAQNRSIIVNMIVPFVRTPANLLSFSMEMIGVNQILSAPRTYNQIMKGSASESQEALARIVVAAGLWISVYELYQNGQITGTGPDNWEERKVWEAAGWQANSVLIHGKWYDISRADPAGQSLVSIASIFDYYAMTQQQNKPMTEWIGAGLLYTADMIVDESYLSTASDVITAIQSKEEARARSFTASLINSVVVPNLLRDFRLPADAEVRSAASENLMDQVVKQMKNASPWNSDELPSGRDWKGDALNRYGNAYQRGLIPFRVRDPENSDPASMALAYARIGPSTPNRSIEWPKGDGDAVNLFAMDGGSGFVYDKYQEIVGQFRHRAVKTAMATRAWERMVRLDNNGPGSDGENVLRRALAVGSHLGRLGMLNWLIDHHGDNAQFRRGNGDLILIHHPVSVSEYVRLRREIRRTDTPLDIQEFPQYQIEHRKEGPTFFKPRTPE